MNSSSFLGWSFSIGTYIQTRVRVHVFLPLLLLVFWHRLQDFPLALTLVLILFVSVVLHEFGHVLMARWSGGFGDEILIWPLGGLAFVRPGPGLNAQFWTAAAGPVVNLALCAVTLPAVLFSNREILSVIHPLEVPAVVLTNASFTILLQSILVLTFVINWKLLIINLLPVYPLDGGRMLQSWLANRMGNEAGNSVYSKIGLVLGVLMLVLGLFIDAIWVVVVGALLLVMNLYESFQLRMGDSYDESFMGYDFSQGYTSLERTDEEVPVKRVGALTRWRQKRQVEKRQKEIQKQQEVEVEMDQILQKVHDNGIESLTSAERRQLNRASTRFQNKRKQDD